MIKMFQTEVQDAKYFSIIIDSTPDITHVDQLTFVLRYITKDGNPVERFFGFLPIYSHTGEALEKVVLEHLESLDLKIADCRGQSYDNAANMSGKYNGVQSRIKQHSETAHFVPCAAHTLNLIGNSAADSCLQATIYYHLLEKIYAFFAASTHRWNILESTFLENRKHLTVKRICDTRWSSRADAVKAIRTGYNEIRKALFDISEDGCQKRLVQIEAKELQNKMNSFEFILMTVIWDKIVSSMNACNKSLQDASIHLSITVNILESLLQFIQDLRNKFEEIENEAMQISEIKAYADTGSRQRKRIRFFDEDQNENNDIHLIGQAAFRVNCFNSICDKICTELKTRCSTYKHLNEMFGIFSLNIDSMSKNISEYTAELKKCYKNDINITELDDELLQFLFIAKNENINSPLDMYSFIKKNNIVSTFPNTEILLRIYLTIPVSNATGERSFSVLKRVKNYLRNSIGQQKLSSLSVLSIEQETLNQLDCEDIIDRFSEMKLRKKRF